MPASSHGLPTSGIRATGAPHCLQAIFTASMNGLCGEWPAKTSQPSIARACNSVSLPMISNAPHASQS